MHGEERSRGGAPVAGRLGDHPRRHLVEGVPLQTPMTGSLIGYSIHWRFRRGLQTYTHTVGMEPRRRARNKRKLIKCTEGVGQCQAGFIENGATSVQYEGFLLLRLP